MLEESIENMDRAAIRAALAPIQNVSSCFPPTNEDYEDGVYKNVKEKIATATHNHRPHVERCSIDVLKKSDRCGGWVLDVLQWNGALDVIDDDPLALCLVTSKSGYEVIITCLYFTA